MGAARAGNGSDGIATNLPEADDYRLTARDIVRATYHSPSSIIFYHEMEGIKI
jgi:hypothetical protein